MNQEFSITLLLSKVGALSRIQHLKQRQQVRTSLGEAEQLAQEQERLKQRLMKQSQSYRIRSPCLVKSC